MELIDIVDENGNFIVQFLDEIKLYFLLFVKYNNL